MQGFQHKLPNQKKLEWGPWLNNNNDEMGSRNLARLGNSLDSQVKRLHIGGDATAFAIANLPRTKHDLQGSEQIFSVDSYPVQPAGVGGFGALMIVVHGQFTERTSSSLVFLNN